MAKPKRNPATDPFLPGRALAEPPGDSLFRALFDNLPNPAYIWRAVGDDFILIGNNVAAARLPFSDVRKLIGRRASELQAGTPADLVSDLRLCLESRSVVRREAEHRYFATGAVRLLALTLMPVCNTIAVMHTEDVTERRRAEEALRQSERKYRRIVDTANEGVWVTDGDGFTTYVNRRMAEMLGYSQDEIPGKQSFDFVAPEARDEVHAIGERVRAGTQEQFDFKLRHKDGSDVWVRVSVAPILDEHGRFSGAISMLSDITSRRLMEQELRASEMRMRALLDAQPDTIVRVTRDGRYLDVHAKPAAEKHLPAAPSAFVGRNVRDIFDEDFARQHEKHRHAALDTGRLQIWEYIRPSKKGNRHMEARFMKSGDDEVVIMLRDITDRVELEQEVIASVERERVRVGHDLHDGLAQLLIGVKLLLEPLVDRLSAEGSAHTETAAKAVQLVGRAIADTRELARGLSPMPKGATFADALRELAEQSEQLLGVPCRLTTDSPPDQLSEPAAMHVYRIVQEAITNAARHGRAKRIGVLCATDRDHLRLTVTDDGVGITAERSAEHGMGLRIMHYRARSLGGELTVAEAPAGGTAVSLVCPLAAVLPAAGERDEPARR